MAAARAVVVYDKNGNLLSRYDSLKEASVATGYKIPTIWSQCKNNGGSVGKIYFRYENNQVVKKKKGSSKRKIVELNKNDEYVRTYENQAEISIEKKMHPSCISRIVNGHLKSKKFKLMYLDEYENLYGKIEKEEVKQEVKKEIIKKKAKEYYINILVGLANGTLIDGAIYNLNNTELVYNKKTNSLDFDGTSIFTKKKMFEEIDVVLPLLLPQERKFLSNLLIAFTNVKSIVKCKDRREGFEYIKINTSSLEDSITLPSFVEGKYYKSLEIDVEYSKEDLDL